MKKQSISTVHRFLFFVLMATVGMVVWGEPVKVGNPGFQYSVPGSFLTVGRCEKGKYMFNTHPGLWMRNVSTCWRENFCRIVPSVGGKDVDVTECAMREGWLEAKTAKGAIEFAFLRPDVVLVRSKSPEMHIRFEYQHPRQKYDFPSTFGRTIDYLHFNADRILMDTRVGVRDPDSGNTVRVHPAKDGIEVAILDIHTGDWDGKEVRGTFDEAVAKQKASFERMYASLPSVPKEFEWARHEAAILFWTAIAGPRGMFRRPMMLMSNNWMNKTWSWDHAINSLSLGYRDQDAAWEQFRCMLDFMSPEGMMPDMVSDEQIFWLAVKPPVHGWVFSKLRAMKEFPKDKLEIAYDLIGKWTNWWLTRRDFDHNGLAEYLDGCDSGWDNSTAICMNRPPLETPDLQAFLILQMECLADIAKTLGRNEESAQWTALAKRMLDATVKILFDEDGAPRVRRLRDGGFDRDSLSLVTRLPMILGKRLPEKCRAKMIDDVKTKGFITEWGLASESVNSKHYQPDGYWKGPIWGPSTLIAVEGLRACGEDALADEISRKFCKLIMKSGFSENFDAKTGETRRDPAYTWTASAFLVLAHELFAAKAELPVVVLPDSPTAVEKSAAEELAGELDKCIGARPRIIAEAAASANATKLFVGATKAAQKARGAAADGTGCRPYQVDEVFLKSVDGGVVLDGDPARAPLYAVDLYLEKYCGVRWWTSDAATYPKLDAAPVKDISLSYAPQFKYRETYYLDGFDPLFKVRSKGNFTSITRYLLDEIKFIPPELGGNHRLFFFEGRHSAYHSFFEILPPKVYFEKHPDWYSLVGGKREPKQLCLANEEMKAEYIKETLKCLRADPTADFIQVSQNDWRGYCTCEKCKALMDEDGGAPSGPYLRFANDVAEAVEKEFPNVRIDTFAYQFTRKAPTKTKPRPNVVVRLCDIECDFARPLDKPLPPHKATFAKDLADWRRVAGGNLFIWDYLANFKSYMMPHPNIGSIAPNIRLFAENGAVGVFEQGDAICSAGSFATLRHYVTAHLLWNPKDDETRLMDEFLNGYYGTAAAPILKKFIAEIEAGPRKTKQIVRCNHKGAPFLHGGDKLKAMQLMDEAVAAAEKEGETFASRVRRERLSIDHMLLLNYDILKDLAAKQKIPWTRPATKAEAVEKWIRDVKSFGVKARRETTRADEIDNYFNTLRNSAGK